MEIDNSEYNKPENIEARKNQEDPWVMYLIVKDSLNMGAGKVGAQCGHAVGMLYASYQKMIDDVNYTINSDAHSGAMDGYEHAMEEHKDLFPIIKKFDEWREKSFRKVVLKCKRDNRWQRTKEELRCVVVRDAGLTEVDPGSETVIGVWPMRKSERPNFLKKLQALK